MKLNLGFSVIARCIKCVAEEGYANEKPLDFELDFTIETAQNLLMRFGPDTIELDNNIVIKFLRKAGNQDFLGILLITKEDETSYFVGNHEQFLRDIHEGYMKISALNKISTIIDFDFEAGLDFQEE